MYFASRSRKAAIGPVKGDVIAEAPGGIGEKKTTSTENRMIDLFGIFGDQVDAFSIWPGSAARIRKTSRRTFTGPQCSERFVELTSAGVFEARVGTVGLQNHTGRFRGADVGNSKFDFEAVADQDFMWRLVGCL